MRRAAAVTAVGLASVWAALAVAGLGAQTRQKPPAVAPERPFSFPAPAVIDMPSGLTVYVVEDHRQPLVSATLMIPAAGASGHEPAKAGLAAMTAALLRQGTASRSAQQIAVAIDRVGGTLGAFAGGDSTQASVSVVTSALDTGFDLLADVVQRPAFADDEIARWRKQTLSNLKVAYADPEYVRDAVVERLAFGDHPYAFPTDGTPATVSALTAEDVKRFYKERYTPVGSCLAIAGDITPDAAAALVKKHFGGWTGAKVPPAAPPASKPARRILVIDTPTAVQTQFGIVGPGVPRNHEDWLPLMVGNQIFGGDFNSRLNLRLRAQEGLTYGARAALDSQRLAGLWNATSYTRTEETARAIRLMIDVIREFRTNPVSGSELGEATSYLSGVFAIQTETAGAVAGRVLTAALHGLPRDYWSGYRERVRAVTAADISRAVERHLDPDTLSIVAVGNAKAFAKELEPLGTVTVVPGAGLDLMALTK